MLRSFLTITLRILWRNKVTSFVNIVSLSIGITSFIFIMLYVYHETSYDTFNEKYDRIYRLEGDDYGKLPPVVGTYVKDRIPEVENVARLAAGFKGNLTFIPEDNPEDLKHAEVNYFWADSTVFDVFTFPFVQGNPKTALTEPMTVVITETTAKKLFYDTDPVGKTVEFNDSEYLITGVTADVTKAHIEVDALFSSVSIPKVYPDRDLNNVGRNSWLWSATYFMMKNDINRSIVEEKINVVLADINNGNLFDLEFKHFYIRPLKDIYFSKAIRNLQYGLIGNKTMINVLLAIGVFILALACINYINLTTARSVIRSKEVALKRVAGSSATLVRFQFIIESVLVSVVSLVVAITILQISLSKFNQLAMTNIQIAELNRPEIWVAALLGTVIIGITAGLYPAFYLTVAKPVSLIKGGILKDTDSSFMRRALTTLQFTVSIVMIICIISNVRQLNYIQHANLGFSKEQVITITTPADIPGEYALRETFKETLLRFPSINGVTFSAGNPGSLVTNITLDVDAKKNIVTFFLVDYDYLDVMGIEVLEGRNFAKDLTRQEGKGYILLNESAVHKLGIKSPVGKILYDPAGKIVQQREVIGVVKDFHFQSLHHSIEPLMLAMAPPMHLASIKIHPSNIPVTLKTIENVWKKVYPNTPFVYEFLDETFDKQYKSDEQLATVIGYFTGLAVIIACLGLFALSSFMVSRRAKEIGVRKTLGASVGSIYSMLSWEFLKWIIVAVIIACPIAWYLVQLWLERFAYHITLGPDIFIIAALISIGIALMTVTWQSLKAATANPVEALRYE